MKLTTPVNSGDHVQGNEGAVVALMEYGDFECPNCLEAYSIIKKIQKIERDRLRIVFRNFPMSQAHPHALHATYAAEAAAKQGKFWEIHDLIFENQDSLEDEDLLNYAKTLNLDMGLFKKDFESSEISEKVKDNFMSGVRSGVNGTPTFFINGVRFDKPCELNLLLRGIDQAKKGGDING